MLLFVSVAVGVRRQLYWLVSSRVPQFGHLYCDEYTIERCAFSLMTVLSYFCYGSFLNNIKLHIEILMIIYKTCWAQGFLCVAGPHVVAPKSPPVVCWPAIGPWQSAIGIAANHKPQHNWQEFGRHYMGTSNTQGPLWIVTFINDTQ